MDNIFSNLKMKWWHAVLIVASFFVFTLSLTVKFVIFDNKTIAFLSSGAFFIALGEFAHQTFQVGFSKLHNLKITKDTRGHNLFGYILELIGIYLLFKALT